MATEGTTRYRLTARIEVDDERLNDHVLESDGARPPYTKDVTEWNFDDILRAADIEIIDGGDCEVVTIEKDDGKI